jgi:hypothetical protein
MPRSILIEKAFILFPLFGKTSGPHYSRRLAGRFGPPSGFIPFRRRCSPSAQAAKMKEPELIRGGACF